MTRKRLDALFDAAQDIAPEHRSAWLAEVCAGDDELQQALQRLLLADACTDGVLESGPELIAQVLTQSVSAPQAFGVWRVLSSLGAGGMGEVWLAERDDAGFVQRAAIKQVAYPTPGLLQRFERERQILARLEHPGIARLIDGGVDAAGCPYLAMEYVEGQRIDAWAREQMLDVRATVKLLVQVCTTVQYAHRNLVVHSDIKPSNILVADDGKPRLLDFGIAKVLNDDSADATQTATRLLTPDYAAPEWLAGASPTTAVDVYALGVLAYELLSGHKPYRLQRKGNAASELAETTITTPSAAIAASLTDARSRKRALHGDLDRVVMTAMAADPSRRYATVEALAADLHRWLDGRAVAARGDGAWYRLRKFIARNRLATSAVMVALLALLAATAFSLRQAQVAREQAGRAETVTRFLTDMFRFADPKGVPGGLKFTARQMLDAGAQRYDRELREQPALAAKFATTLSTIYRELGEYDHAITLADDALKHTDIAPVDRAHTLAELAQAQYEKGDYHAAQASIDQAQVLHTNAYGKRSASVAADIALSGEIARRQGDFKLAQTLTKQALAMSRARLKAPDAQIADELNQLAVLYGDMRQVKQARAPTEQALKMFRKLYGENHLDVAENLVNLGTIDMQTGKVDEAISLFEKGEAIYHRLLLGDYPALANTLTNHARALDRVGRYQESMDKYSQALAMLRRLFGDDHPDLAAALNNLAVLQYKLGDFRGAADHFRQVLTIWKKQGTPNHPLAQISTIHLASTLRDLGDAAQSEALLRPAIVQAEKTFGANHPATLLARIELGVTLRSENKFDESLSLQREAITAINKNPSLPPLFKAKAELQLILTQLAAGDKLAAKTHMQALQKSLASIKSIDPLAKSEFLLADARVTMATGDEATGCGEAKQALAMAQTVFGKHNVRTERAAQVANSAACTH